MRADSFFHQFKKIQKRQFYYVLVFFLIVLFLVSVYSGGFFIYVFCSIFILFIITLSLSVFSLLGLHLDRQLSQNEIDLGQVVDGQLILHNKKDISARWIFCLDHIDVHLDVEGPSSLYQSIPPQSKVELNYRLHSTRRGFFRVGPAVVESGGLFGLIKRFLVCQPVDFVTVFPRIVAIDRRLPRGQMPVHQVPRRRSLFDDPSRFLGLRDYQPGDSMRRIHWKASARSQRLQVKLFEPSTLTGVLFVLDMGLDSYPQTRLEPDSIDPVLELAVTAAASLAGYILVADQQVGLLANGNDVAEKYSTEWTGGTFRRLNQVSDRIDKSLPVRAFVPVEVSPAKGFWQRNRILSALARLVPSPSLTLSDFLTVELPRLPRHLAIVIITPHINPELGYTLGSLKRSDIDVSVCWIVSNTAINVDTNTIPMGIPLFRISSEADLSQMGVFSL